MSMERMDKDFGDLELVKDSASIPHDVRAVYGSEEDWEIASNWVGLGVAAAKSMLEVPALEVDTAALEKKGIESNQYDLEKTGDEINSEITEAIVRGEEIQRIFNDNRYDFQRNGDFPKSPGKGGLPITVACFALDKTADIVRGSAGILSAINNVRKNHL